jgi:hypothetical protein
MRIGCGEPIKQKKYFRFCNCDKVIMEEQSRKLQERCEVVDVDES